MARLRESLDFEPHIVATYPLSQSIVFKSVFEYLPLIRCDAAVTMANWPQRFFEKRARAESRRDQPEGMRGEGQG